MPKCSYEGTSRKITAKCSMRSPGVTSLDRDCHAGKRDSIEINPRYTLGLWAELIGKPNHSGVIAVHGMGRPAPAG